MLAFCQCSVMKRKCVVSLWRSANEVDGHLWRNKDAQSSTLYSSRWCDPDLVIIGAARKENNFFLYTSLDVCVITAQVWKEGLDMKTELWTWWSSGDNLTSLHKLTSANNYQTNTWSKNTDERHMIVDCASFYAVINLNVIVTSV